jgi:O-antigen/teichoic acid export membrane protein
MLIESSTNAARRKALLQMLLSYTASGGSLIISSTAQLLTFAILARALGVHEFSLFVAITAISNIAVHMCGLGAMECLVRRVARDRSIYPDMLGHNVILTAASGTALVLLGAAILPMFFKLADDPASNVAIITLMLVTSVVLVRIIVLAEQIFIAHSQFGSANIVVIGFAVARTIAAGLACLVFSTATVADWAIWQFACHVLCALLGWLMIQPLGRPRFRLVREELPQGLYFAIPFILRAIRQNADLLVLSLVATAEIVASYSVARRILDSTYLSVEALNRLVYPGSARATADGLQHAMPRVRKVLVAATAISFMAACTVYVMAPVLPLLFGRDYLSLVGFARVLCWVVVPMAIWAVALEALGASGQQAARGLVLGLGSILGAALTAGATWLAPPTGTFVAFYVIEIAMAFAAWGTLLRMIRYDSRTNQP